MSDLALQPTVAVALVLFAAYLMSSAGRAKRRLLLRNPRCSVCDRPRDRCVCRWL